MNNTNNINDAFKNKTLVITGGTGSFGSTVLKHFLTTDIGEIRIISRDEKKQDWMRHATCNDLQKIITQAINEIKQEQGENFNLAKINLAELERRTGLSRSRLRHLKENNFIVTPHGRTGQKATATILTGYSGIIDGLFRKGVTNSSVCFERLQEAWIYRWVNNRKNLYR